MSKENVTIDVTDVSFFIAFLFSYLVNKSVLWAVLHGLLGITYVIYSLLVYHDFWNEMITKLLGQI